MPLSFVDMDDGEWQVVDERGLELDGIDTVARETLESQRDLARVHMPEGIREMSTSVRNMTGGVVHRGAVSVDGRRFPPISTG